MSANCMNTMPAYATPAVPAHTSQSVRDGRQLGHAPGGRRREMSEQTKYEVRSSVKFGRYLVASAALQAGEVILQEAPLVVGPTSDSPLLCFQCHAPLAGKFSCCAACRRAPVCADRACANTHKSGRWHDEAECSLFSAAAEGQLSALTLVGQVAALTPLRCLLKRSADPAAWRQLMSMEHHLDERRGTDIWLFHQSTVEFIESLGLVGAEDAELVQKLCGIIDVNSFEVRGGGGAGAGEAGAPLVLRGVYPRAALMAHHCVGNTHLAVGADHSLTVRAARVIAPGELIYNNYVDALQGTAKRQERLRIGKYFTCECERCLDPTELGTHLSSIACVACRAGLVVPPPHAPPAPPPPRVHRTDTSHVPEDTQRDVVTALEANNAVAGTKEDCTENLNSVAKSICNENGVSIEIDSSTPKEKSHVSENTEHDCLDITTLKVKNEVAGTEEDYSENPNIHLPLVDSSTETKSVCNENGVPIDSSFPKDKPNDKLIPDCAETESKTVDSADPSDTKTDGKADVTNGATQNVETEGVCNGAGRDTRWSCEACGEKFDSAAMEDKVRACSNKLASINAWEESALEEYVREVSAALSPRHYLVLEAAQALAGVLRARIHRAPRPVASLLRTMVRLCTDLLRVLEVLRPGISRAKAITLYELQATSVRLAKKLFEAREITAEAYMSELESGQGVLKRAVAMLVLEPSEAPEGALCAHALQELRDLRGAARALADAANTDTLNSDSI